MAYDTFISYSHSDKARAEKVRDHLQHAGLSVWMDRDQIRLGGFFRRTISDGLRQSRSVTPILTSNALASSEVFNEVSYGVENRLKIVPVVLNPNELNQSERWRTLLQDVDWGRLNPTALSRNITPEVLADIEAAVRQPDERRCPVIAVYHFKGGVGKTTVSAYLGAQLYERTRPALSVLMVDCDAQYNLSTVFLKQQQLQRLSSHSHNLIGMLEPNRVLTEPDQFGIYDVAPGTINDQVLGKVQTLLHSNDDTSKVFSIIPNSIKAAKYGTVNSAQHSQLYQNFQNAIQKLSLQYDMIILDCNPCTTLLTECALNAATDIIIPLRADKYTTDGLENIDELLGDFFGLDFIHGEGRHKKQVWTLINYADQRHIDQSNEERSQGPGTEDELLRDMFNPLRAGTSIGSYKVALLSTRVPESGFLRSKPIESLRLSTRGTPLRNLLRSLSDRRASRTADAFKKLALEVRSKTQSPAFVLPVS